VAVTALLTIVIALSAMIGGVFSEAETGEATAQGSVIASVESPELALSDARASTAGSPDAPGEPGRPEDALALRTTEAAPVVPTISNTVPRTVGGSSAADVGPSAATLAALLRIVPPLSSPPPASAAPRPERDPLTDPIVTPAAGTYVIATDDGLGVSHRDDCRQDARVRSAGWLDGQRVALLGEGLGRCLGWVLVGAGGVSSWVPRSWLSSAA
jgi:hypothetical protein